MTFVKGGGAGGSAGGHGTIVSGEGPETVIEDV
jgi:hypothetical protein